MREHDTGKSLGLTCRKAFSNMQISTQLQYSGGAEGESSCMCLYLIHTDGSLSFIELLFSKLN